MNRKDFFKKLAIGTGAVILTPQLLKAESSVSEGKLKLAIDIQSISGMTMGGRKISAAEILEIYHETGFLLYQSHDVSMRKFNPPMVFNGEVEVIDVAGK